MDSFIPCIDGRLPINIEEISRVFPIIGEIRSRWTIDAEIPCPFLVESVSSAVEIALGKKRLDSLGYYPIYKFYASPMRDPEFYLEEVTSVEDIFHFLEESIEKGIGWDWDTMLGNPYKEGGQRFLCECASILRLKANKVADYKNAFYMKKMCELSRYMKDVFAEDVNNPNLVMVLQSFIYHCSTEPECMSNAILQDSCGRHTQPCYYELGRLFNNINLFMIPKANFIVWHAKERFLSGLQMTLEDLIMIHYKDQIKHLPHSRSVINGKQFFHVGDNDIEIHNTHVLKFLDKECPGERTIKP